MKKGCLWIVCVMLLLSACSGKVDHSQQGQATPQNTQTTTPSPEPPKDTDDFSMTTTLPDGTQRIEARVLDILDNVTLKIRSVNGEEELKLSEKVSNHAKILGVTEQSKIIVTLKDGVADTIELVTGE